MCFDCFCWLLSTGEIVIEVPQIPFQGNLHTKEERRDGSTVLYLGEEVLDKRYMAKLKNEGPVSCFAVPGLVLPLCMGVK